MTEKVFLAHILQNIECIETFVKDMTFLELKQDKLRQYAIIRAIEIMGEATKNLPEAFKKQHSETPWKEIIRARDKMIHYYFGINLETVWKIIKEDIPQLKAQLLAIQKELA